MTTFATPQNQDLFTRFMVEGFDENEVAAGVSTVWLPFFGSADTGGRTLFSPDRNVVDIDIIRGNEKYAKMRLRGVGSENIGDIIKRLRDQQFSSVSRTYPLMEDMGHIGSDQLNFRQFGQSAEMNSTKQSRLRALAARQFVEIQRRFVRSFNKLAGQSLLEGVQDAIFGTTNSDLQYDFYRNSDHQYTVPVAWDNASALIMANLDVGCARVRQNGRTTPDSFFTTGPVIDAMISDSEISALAANRRFNFTGLGSTDGGVNPVSEMPARYQKFIDSGWLYRGWVETPAGYKLYLFTTNDIIEEDGGTFSPMIPSGQGLLCSTTVRADRYFGPDEKLPMTPMRRQMSEELFGISLEGMASPLNIKNGNALIRPDMFAFDAWPNLNWTDVTLRCQSAPIFAPVHTDAYVTFKGLLT